MNGVRLKVLRQWNTSGQVAKVNKIMYRSAFFARYWDITLSILNSNSLTVSSSRQFPPQILIAIKFLTAIILRIELLRIVVLRSQLLRRIVVRLLPVLIHVRSMWTEFCPLVFVAVFGRQERLAASLAVVSSREEP
jgi:hypothetical protein